MRLKEEKLEYTYDLQGFVKHYNEDGFLVFEKNTNVGTGYNIERKIVYDSDNHIIKENIIESNVNTLDEDLFLKLYKYDGKSYTVVTYKKHTRNIGDSQNQVLHGNEINTWQKVDEIIKIEEYKFNHINLISKKVSDLENNQGFKEIYSYDKSDTLYRKSKYEKNILVRETEYIYENQLLICENKYHFFKNNKFLAFQIKYEYNSEKKLSKKKTYGRYNSKMYLNGILELEYANNTEIKRSNYIVNISKYFGYYDYETMIKEVKYSGDDFIEHLTRDLAETYPLESPYKQIKKFDNKKNLIEYWEINPENDKEIYCRKIYSNEYNKNGDLEMITCLEIGEKKFKKIYTHKYFYY